MNPKVTSSRRSGRQGPPKKRSNKTRTRKNRNRQAKRIAAASLSESKRIAVQPCTYNYAKVLANPFDPVRAGEICLPDDSDAPSFKFHTKVRGTFHTGTGGTGYITMGSQVGANSGLDWILHSTAAFDQTTVTGAAVAGKDVPVRSTSPFHDAGGLMPASRCVAVGLRIRYIGTELNRGGQLCAWKSKTAGGPDTMTGLNYDRLASNLTANPQPVDRKWHSVVWSPYQAIDRNYYKIDTPYAVTAAPYQNRCLGFMVQSPSTSISLPFEYEAVGYYEAIPLNDAGVTYAPPSVSASDSDSAGYSFVRNVFSSVADSTTGQALWDQFLRYSKEYVMDKVPFGPAAIEL